jgi:protein Mpv17
MRLCFSPLSVLLLSGILLPTVTGDGILTTTKTNRATGVSLTCTNETFSHNSLATPLRVSKSGAAKTISKISKNSTYSLQGAFKWYMNSCVEKPLVTKGLTCGVICSLGDLIAQKLESQNRISGKSWLNLSRLATFFVCNALFTGPFVHYWYQTVADAGSWAQKRFGISQWKKLGLQVLMDQSVGVLLFFPLYLVFYDLFDALIRLHQVPSLRQAVNKCTHHLRQVILMQYRIFPIANTINFAFVPQQLRVLFSNTVSLFWNIYLCSIVA